MLLEKARIYGVDGVGQSSPSLTRTDGAVGMTYSKGASEIHSDFDKCFPWSDMHEVVDEFGNVFIYIPKFYSKITKNANGTYKHQISGFRYEGFSTLFVDGKGNEIDYVLVGKYEASGDKTKAYSKSGATCLVNITLPQLRTACMAHGEGYQQYDFLIDAISITRVPKRMPAFSLSPRAGWCLRKPCADTGTAPLPTLWKMRLPPGTTARKSAVWSLIVTASSQKDGQASIRGVPTSTG